MKNKSDSLGITPDVDILASNGRDELNIAEFPIALLTDRPPEGLKSISFSDRMVDRGETITRTVTVEGSAKYGLPMPFDMDVLLCLMQLTKAANNFTDPQVFFTRADVLKLMRLVDSGSNYARLDDSLRRWHGVSLFYDQSWWDRAENCWTTQEGIHIIENINIISKKSEKRGRSRAQPDQFRCSITWNSIFFKSCQAKNIKYLDMNKYLSLERPISRQMYRFLDKRFYRGPSWSFDLQEFAFEHIGISRNYDTGQIKSKLRPAIEELEAIGFLEPLKPGERYRKDGKGWKILLASAVRPPVPSDGPKVIPEASGLVAELVRRGVTRATADDLVRAHPAGRIEAKLEVFDWLMEGRDGRVARSPAGYLVKSIVDDYAEPRGFVPRAERRRREEARRDEQRRAAEEHRRRREEDAREGAERRAVAAYWDSLTPEQQDALDAAARAAADPGAPAPERGPLARLARQVRRHEHIRRLLVDRGELPGAG